MVMSQNGARSSGGAAAQAADLGPLAWVLEETRRSIETASKKTISFARDAKASLGVDMSSVDASQLRLARQQLHQAVGALEMVGQPVASQMVRGMEAVVQQFAQHPDKCTDESASVLEQAGFALLEYLEGVLGDKPRPALGLFPQYARIQTMAGADRVHPADLWDFQWHWANPDTPAAAQRNTYSAEVRSRLDHCVLNIMRRADLNAVIEMGVVCLGLADGEESGQKPAVFWKLASAFMQALGVQAAPLDIYAKRATSRILLQYATLAGGDKKISERLAQDLLFFCAQADMQGKDAPVLAAVRKAWGLSSYTPIPYDKPIFGLYDPAVLEQASRRIEAIKENWSALAGGDMGRLKACVDQFGLVVESLTRLHQNSKPLADALSRVSEHVAKTAQPPSHELAMETATAVLFLEASFADFQPSDAEFTRRLNQLAERLDAVRSGQQAPELESWMEELYRRVSDRETLGTVVGELRTTLGEAEQLLDQFLRAPDDRQPLETANTLLGQMRGVLMVLGLEPAAHAVSRMRESITSWQKTEGNPAQGNDEELEHFGNSLGALASLVDMMGYQPALAGELFFYDEESGELKYDASRAQPPQPLQEAGDVLSAEEPQQAASSAAEEVEDLLSQALDVLQSVAGTSPAEPQPHEQQEEPEEEPIDEGLDAELLEIFLEEAREVVQTGSAALQTLASAPGDMEQQTTLRRAFHTLKGSSRMVGLTEFGEAAWALEQVMNAWLAEKKPVSDNLRTLTGDALQAFGRWVEDISIRRSGRWKSAPFRTSADAFRLEGKLMPLELATEKKTAAPEPASTSVVAPEPAPAAPAPAVAAAPEPVAPVVAAASEPTAPDPVAAPEPIAAAEVPDELPLDISADIEIEAVQAPCAPVDEPEVIQFEASAGFEEPAAQAVDVAEMADASIGLVAEEMPEGEEQLVSLESIELPSLDLPLAEEDASEPSAEVPPVAPEAAEPQPEQAEDDDTKHIGDLVISTSLYNVYLEEAEKQSHQLMDELERWAADVSRPVPEGAGISAHSLAGNSATVGFTGLSELARAVEHALQRLQEQAHGTERQAKVLCDAANEIRSVLHQFAAGTFKNPSIVVQARVRALEPVPTSPAPLTANIPPAPVAEAPASAPTVPPAAIELPAPAQAVPEVEVQPAAPIEIAPVVEAAPVAEPPAPEPAVPAAPIELAPSPAAFEVPPAPIEIPAAPAAVPSAPTAAPPAAPVAAPATVAAAGGTFAGIQEVDDFNPDMFEIFSEEAEDLLPRLDEALRTWAASPNSLEANKEVRRVLHTFKGGARVAGALRLGEMAHRIESAIETVGTEGVQAEAVEAVQADVDELQDAFRRVQETGSSAPLQSEPPAPVAAPAQPAALSSQPPVVVSASQPAVVAQPAAPAPVAAQPAPAPVQPATAAPVPQPAPAALAQPLPKPTLPAAPIEVPAAAVATAPVPSAPRDGLEDIADLRDAVDPDLFPIVVEEAQEMFPRLTEFLRVWGASPEASEPREGMMRALHALKGSARMAGARRLGEMAHRTEASIAAISTEDEVSAADVAAIAANVDKLQDLLREMQGKPPVQKKPTPAPKPAQAPAAAPAPASQQAAATPAAAVRPQPTGQVAPPAPLSMVQARAAASQAVRVRSQLLDRLVTQSGEVMTSRARLEVGVNHLRTALGDLTGNLERLRQQLRDVEMQAESQLQSRQALARDDQRNFDPLEFDRFTRLQELTRMMAESVNDVATVQRGLQRAVESCENDLAAQARQSRELQRDLLRTRMVEFESISERLYRVVRQAAREVGKKVRMDITGGTIEMDRGILERMTGAFEHLLRNSVTHGIEDEDVRVARNKDATGLVSVDVQQAGNDVSITFRDDGAGLNLERIREKAIQKGIITPEQKLSNDEIARLVFASGLSTAAKVSGLAGRGVGMDVVRSEVQALGGRIEIGTEPGKGSSFRLVLPLTMAVTHVVMLRCGKLQVGVPSNVVEIVRRVTQEQLQEAYRSGHYSYGGEELDFYWSGALLQSSTRSTEPPARTMPVVIFRSAAQRVAVHVDEVLSNQEVVVKALGPQLSRLPGLVAITSLASGEVALIYNPVALAAVYGEQARRQVQAAQQPEVAAQAGAPAALAPEETPAAAPLVLVVDDSITVRRVTQRMLQREGFRVAMAADGLQGLERLQEERPAVVLSDIEMPRMDGFDFVRNIRADERMAGLPVIMITSRIADKHREHAQELGVNHYLGKPYSEETLLGLIRQYAGVAVPAQ